MALEASQGSAAPNNVCSPPKAFETEEGSKKHFRPGFDEQLAQLMKCSTAGVILIGQLVPMKMQNLAALLFLEKNGACCTFLH